VNSTPSFSPLLTSFFPPLSAPKGGSPFVTIDSPNSFFLEFFPLYSPCPLFFFYEKKISSEDGLFSGPPSLLNDEKPYLFSPFTRYSFFDMFFFFFSYLCPSIAQVLLRQEMDGVSPPFFPSAGHVSCARGTEVSNGFFSFFFCPKAPTRKGRLYPTYEKLCLRVRPLRPCPWWLTFSRQFPFPPRVCTRHSSPGYNGAHFKIPNPHT